MTPFLWRFARGTGFALLAVAILSIGAWCSIAIWYRCGSGEPVRGLLSGATVVFALVAVAALATPRRWLAVAGYAASFALPCMVDDDNAIQRQELDPRCRARRDRGHRRRSPGGENVRNFAWRSDTDFDQRWEQRTYNLSQVTNVDLILSYWSGEAIAHLIVSFGFADGARLAFSIETRKQRDEAYSTIAGFFRQYELTIVAADEHDVVRVRSNMRGEDVRIYRLRMPPAYAQALLREYVADANDLARHPAFTIL